MLWIAAGPVSAHAQETHLHGVGHINIAIEGSRLEIVIEGPGDNFVGFEHVAETAEERSALSAVRHKLRQPATLLVLPKTAECALREVDLDVPTETAMGKGQEHGKRDHEYGHEDEGGHDDWSARYVFACAVPSALRSIRVAPWFAAFPNTRELLVQVISDFGQSGLTLTPAHSGILLRTR